ACKAKFGTGVGAILKAAPPPLNTLGAALPPDEKIDELEIKLTSPTKANIGSGRSAMNAEKQGERWRLSVPANAPSGPIAGILKGLGTIAEPMSADVRAGKYADQQAFLTAFTSQAMPMLQKAIPAMQPGGKRSPGGG